MKKLIAFALIFVLLLSALAGCEKKEQQAGDQTTADTDNASNAVTEQEEPAVTPDAADFDYIRENGGVTILGYKGTEKRIAIPAEINGKTVLCIKQFQSETVEYLRIPDSVNELAEEAFVRNNVIKEVIIGNGIEILPRSVFGACVHLERVVMGNGVKTISMQAFHQCKALKHVIFSNQLQVINGRAFADCDALEEIILPQGLQRIEYEAFAYSNLKSITIPATTRSIGTMAFDRNVNLSSVSFEDGAQFFDQTIFGSGVSMFHDCSALKSLIIPASVTIIHAFSFTTIGNNSPSTLESIHFLGNAPTVYGIDNMPDDFVPHKEIIVYYSPNTAGWDTTPLADLYTLTPYTGD